ncbi:MAG: DUF3267 domain-containing protein [Syntrophomonas sp.]
MRYTRELPKTDRELFVRLLGQGWKRLREPGGLWTAVLLSIPFMILNGAISWFLFLRHHKPLIIVINGSALNINLDLNIIAALLMLLFIVLFHEFCHLVFIPDFIKSEKTCWGIGYMGGFVFTEEELSKSRFIVISLAPFIVISVIIPVILELLGLLNSLISFAAFINALGASVDLLSLTLVAFQVPSNARIKSNGSETFYKPPTEEPLYN